MNQNKFSEKEEKKYIEPYLQIVKRNKTQIYKRLLVLAEQHIDRIAEVEDPEMMELEEKIEMVY